MPSPTGLEREVKLRFDSADAARSAVAALRASDLRPRRLQDDVILDTDTGALQQRGCALRVRRDGAADAVTFKGAVLPAAMKVREEIETAVGDAETLLRVFAELGFRPRFRYQKFRTELSLPGLVIAIDETPIGTYVELEGEETAIADATRCLGRTPDDYVRASYRSLFLDWSRGRGASATDMLFGPA